MTISVNHSLVSLKTDDADTSIVRPSDWNADHTLTMADNKLLGRATAGTGPVEEITLGSNLSFTGTTLNAADIADGDKGDVTVSAGVWTIDADAVTYAKLQNTSAASSADRARRGCWRRRSAGDHAWCQSVDVRHDVERRLPMVTKATSLSPLVAQHGRSTLML